MQKEWKHKGFYDLLRAEEIQHICGGVRERTLMMCGQCCDINRHFKQSKRIREKVIWNPKLKSIQNHTTAYTVLATNAL